MGCPPCPTKALEYAAISLAARFPYTSKRWKFFACKLCSESSVGGNPWESEKITGARPSESGVSSEVHPAFRVGDAVEAQFDGAKAGAMQEQTDIARDAQFFAQFASQALLGRFAGFDLSAGKFP